MTRTLQDRVNELEERDVLILLKAYKYLPPQTLGASMLFKKLNETVVELALENQEMVNFNFLSHYLATFFDIPHYRDIQHSQK